MKHDDDATLDDLSDRDRQVAHLVAQGYTQRAIADALGRSEGWVQWRLNIIYGRLRVRNKAGLAALVGEARRARWDNE